MDKLATVNAMHIQVRIMQHVTMTVGVVAVSNSDVRLQLQPKPGLMRWIMCLIHAGS